MLLPINCSSGWVLFKRASGWEDQIFTHLYPSIEIILKFSSFGVCLSPQAHLCRSLEVFSNSLWDKTKPSCPSINRKASSNSVNPPETEYTKKINPNDEVIEDIGVKVFVDSAAIMYLLGTEMDYKKDELSSSFVFNNPNETERCGCGESFKIS